MDKTEHGKQKITQIKWNTEEGKKAHAWRIKETY